LWSISEGADYHNESDISNVSHPKTEKGREDAHKPNIYLIEHGENIRPSSTERVGPGRDRRINEEVESQIKRRDREPIE